VGSERATHHAEEEHNEKIGLVNDEEESEDNNEVNGVEES